MEKGVNCHGSLWAGVWCKDCPLFGAACDIMTEEYEPFGDKWEKEIMQLTKPMLIEFLRKAYIKLNKKAAKEKT